MEQFTISVKVNEKERSQIKANAEAVGMSISKYIRQVALNPNIELKTDVSKAEGALCELGYQLQCLGVRDDKMIAKEMHTLWQCLRK